MCLLNSMPVFWSSMSVFGELHVCFLSSMSGCLELHVCLFGVFRLVDIVFFVRMDICFSAA